MTENPEDRVMFQVNLKVPPRDRARYIKWLASFVPDPRVALYRMVVGMVSVAVLVFVVMFLLSGNNARLPYIILPVLMIIVSWLTVTFIYVIPSREGKSMLSTVIESLTSQLGERLRIRSSHNGALYSVGVSAIDDDGLMHFSSGDVGYLYEVEGQVGPSTLPAIVREVNRVRHNWLVGRESTSGSESITTINRKDSANQLDYYREVYKNRRRRNDPDNMLAASCARLQYDYTDKNIHRKDVHISQYMIIRDVDELSLVKSARRFSDAVGRGMLASAVMYDNRDDVVKVLSPVIMTQGENVGGK